jgi:hypothetical protein
MADICKHDGKPCHVSAGTDDAHWRCGTSACQPAADASAGRVKEAMDRFANPSAGPYDEDEIWAAGCTLAAEVTALTARLKEVEGEREALREALGKIWEMDTHVVWSGGSAPEPMYDESGSFGELAAKALAALTKGPEE